MKKNEITIIIVTFNSKNHIEKCLDSIANSVSKGIKINTIIIDNNSEDKTVDIIKKYQNGKPPFVLIENNSNIGFASAVNQGIRKAKKSDYILLLNPDTILEKESLVNLVNCSEKSNAGICGGTTIDNQGNNSGSYFRFPNLSVGLFDFTNLRKLRKNDKWHKYFYYLDSNHGKDCFPVDVITGGYMLIKMSTINIIGLFDESFFMYLEDVDYCLRAKNAGIKIFHTDISKILHIGGASSDNKDRIRHSSWLKSRKIYFFKHFGLLENLIIQPIFLIDDIIIILRKLL